MEEEGNDVFFMVLLDLIFLLFWRSLLCIHKTQSWDNNFGLIKYYRYLIWSIREYMAEECPDLHNNRRSGNAALTRIIARIEVPAPDGLPLHSHPFLPIPF